MAFSFIKSSFFRDFKCTLCLTPFIHFVLIYALRFICLKLPVFCKIFLWTTVRYVQMVSCFVFCRYILFLFSFHSMVSSVVLLPCLVPINPIVCFIRSFVIWITFPFCFLCFVSITAITETKLKGHNMLPSVF